MWKSPFNYIVRSKEALVIGLLVGVIIGGIIGAFLNPITIKGDVYDNPISLCEKKENVKSVVFSFQGKPTKIVCKDGRVFDKNDLS